MGLLYSSYYGLIRVNELGPETKDWAVTDANVENISLLLNAINQHSHTGAVAASAGQPSIPLHGPGYWELSTPTSTLTGANFTAEIGKQTVDASAWVYPNNLATPPIGFPSTATPPAAGVGAVVFGFNSSSTTPSISAWGTGTSIAQPVVGQNVQAYYYTASATPLWNKVFPDSTQIVYVSTSSEATPYIVVSQAPNSSFATPTYSVPTTSWINIWDTYTAPKLTLGSDPATPGYLAPGTTVGVRLAYTDATGLETEAAPETYVTVPAIATPPQMTATPSTYTIAGSNSKAPKGQQVSYVVSLYNPSTGGETLPSDPKYIQFPSTTAATTTGIQLNGLPDLYNLVQPGATPYLKIYRAIGGIGGIYNLIGYATPALAAGTTIYKDDLKNANPAYDATQRPPTIDSYNSNYYLNIDWSKIVKYGAIPSATPGQLEISNSAAINSLKLYVTQQSGIWGDTHLLNEYDQLDSTFPFAVTYAGTETLSKGYPLDDTRVLNAFAKIDLGTQATGAPIYTTQADAKGFPTQNFVVGSSSVSTPGALYYNGSGLTLQTGSGTVALGSVSATPTHDMTDQIHGHLAKNIAYGGSNNLEQIANLFATPASTYPGALTTPATTYGTSTTSLSRISATIFNRKAVSDDATAFTNMTGSSSKALSSINAGLTMPVTNADCVSISTGFDMLIFPAFIGQWIEVTFQSMWNYYVAIPTSTTIARPKTILPQMSLYKGHVSSLAVLAGLTDAGAQVANSVPFESKTNTATFTSSYYTSSFYLSYATPASSLLPVRFQIQGFTAGTTGISITKNSGFLSGAITAKGHI